MKPKSVNICGITYSITYVEKPSDVDIFKRDSLWGQVDYWTRTIRIYDDGNRTLEDVWHVIFHEVLHSIFTELKIPWDHTSKDGENILDLLALGLCDTLFRNDWLKLDE